MMDQEFPLILTEKNLSNKATFDMILAEGDEFYMGGADEEAYDDEKSIHRVRLPSFYLEKYPVTQLVWRAVSSNPSQFKNIDSFN